MLNKAQIIGHLGADIELRSMPNGGSAATVNVATTRRWLDKNSQERKEHTEWHRVVMFNKTAEIAAQYLRKGSKVYFEGRLCTQKWTDAQGLERYTTEIVAENMIMLDNKPNEENKQQSTTATPQNNKTPQRPQQQPNSPAQQQYARPYQDDYSFNDDIPF